MLESIEYVEEHYEVREVAFGRIYKWCPQSVLVECDCGEQTTFDSRLALSSCVALCECGLDYIDAIEEELRRHQPGALGRQVQRDYEETHHPWLYDRRAQKEQHLRDEAAYPVGSPWRYNDVTSRTGESIS